MKIILNTKAKQHIKPAITRNGDLLTKEENQQEYQLQIQNGYDRNIVVAE